MKLIHQHDERDCAATCLEMISRNYGVHITHSELLEMTKTDSSGTNLYGIVDAAVKIGFESEGLEGTPDELEEAIVRNEICFPFIAHIVTEDNLLHFVVVSKWRKGRFLIYDPGKGKYWQDSSEFYERWTGYIATITNRNSLKKREKK